MRGRPDLVARLRNGTERARKNGRAEELQREARESVRGTEHYSKPRNDEDSSDVYVRNCFRLSRGSVRRASGDRSLRQVLEFLCPVHHHDDTTRHDTQVVITHHEESLTIRGDVVIRRRHSGHAAG